MPWRTRTGEALGSPSYRAPEQSRNPAAAGREADIYGMGGLLYFLVTGQRPRFFYMMTHAEFADATAGFPPDVAELNLHRDGPPPRPRCRTAAEMASAVAAAYDGLPGVQEPPVAARWMRAFEPSPERASLWGRLLALVGRSSVRTSRACSSRPSTR